MKKVEVRRVHDRPGQHGLFAHVDITSGHTVFELNGYHVERPTRTSIQVSRSRHIEWYPDSYFGFFNHSCAPNCAIDGPALRVYALEDIPALTELRFDYNSTEYELDAPFACLCGAQGCVGRVLGYKHLKPKQREKISRYTAEHLKTSVNPASATLASFVAIGIS